MKMTREYRGAITYTIHNSDSSARDVVIEHPVQDGWKLTNGIQPEETSARHYRFRVKVEPGKTETLEVAEFRPDVAEYSLSNLTPQAMTMFAQEKILSSAIEAALQRIMGKKLEIGNIDRELNLRQKESESIDRDQARVRENMKALKGTPEEKSLLQRYTRQLNSQEDRMTALKKEIETFQSERTKLSAELDRMIEEVVIDEKVS
jgi:hypothetical protein